MNNVIVVGSFVQDLAFQTPTFPAPGETRIGLFVTGPGGKGFNQAVACNRLECPTLFIGAVGEDVFADSVATFAKQENLQTAFETIRGVPTGAASIVVNERAENMIVVALGANERLTSAHVLRSEAEFKNAELVVCQLESSLPAAETALKLARKYRKRTLLNPAPINPDVTGDLLGLADILIPNETELAFLLERFAQENVSGEIAELSNADLHTLCRKLSLPTVIVTLGAGGAFVSNGAAELRPWSKGEPSCYRVPAIDVAPVDTTGAGDAFSGALAAALVRYPNELQQAVRYANASAGLSTQNRGTAPAMPRKHEVEQRLKGE